MWKKWYISCQEHKQQFDGSEAEIPDTEAGNDINQYHNMTVIILVLVIIIAMLIFGLCVGYRYKVRNQSAEHIQYI